MPLALEEHWVTFSIFNDFGRIPEMASTNKLLKRNGEDHFGISQITTSGRPIFSVIKRRIA